MRLTRDIARAPETPALVLTDRNQITHAEATRISGRKMRLDLPCFSYRILMPGLDGPSRRMSVNRPESAIFLDDTATEMRRKFRHAFTGGRTTAAEQKLRGGDPQVCSFFQAAELLQDDGATETMYHQCISGEVLCEECKSRNTDRLLAAIEPIRGRHSGT